MKALLSKMAIIRNLWNLLKITLFIVVINILIVSIYRRKEVIFSNIGFVTVRPSFTSMMSTYAKTVEGDDKVQRKLIILAMTDVSFTDMATNLYESSFKRFHVENYIFIGTGRTACEVLIHRDIHCFYYTDDPSSNHSDIFGSQSFIRKMNIRTKMVIEALAAGFSVVHTDLDVVFVSNPMPEIEKNLTKYDMMLLWDYAAYNAGFVIINPTSFSQKVYRMMQDKTNKSATLDDQKALNQVIGFMRTTYADTFSKLVSRLSEKKYLCGKMYFEIKDRNFPPSNKSENNCPGCLVVHNNWIVSKEAKRYRFKEALMWFVDWNGYYSDRQRKYLSYANPFITNPPESMKITNVELDALKTALMISQMLNRTLILPRFHCHGRGKPRECSLLNYLSIRDIDKYFADKYRENSFFLNSLIPEDLKLFEQFYRNHYSLESPGIPPVYTIKTKSNYKFLEHLDFNNTNILDFLSTDVVLEESILEKLGNIKDKVLHLSSLLGIQVSFKDKEISGKFNESIKHSFVKKGYIQFK